MAKKKDNNCVIRTYLARCLNAHTDQNPPPTPVNALGLFHPCVGIEERESGKGGCCNEQNACRHRLIYPIACPEHHNTARRSQALMLCAPVGSPSTAVLSLKLGRGVAAFRGAAAAIVSFQFRFRYFMIATDVNNGSLWGIKSAQK